MKQLEKGKLYQVRNYREGWIIAKYSAGIDAHIAHGINFKGQKEWREPASHYFRTIPSDSTIIIRDRDLELRDVPEETLQQIAEMQQQIETTKAAHQAALKALREFCN